MIHGYLQLYVVHRVGTVYITVYLGDMETERERGQRLYSKTVFRDCIQRLYSETVFKETWCMEPYVGVDHNLTLCLLQSRLQHMYRGQPYAMSTLNLLP